MKIREIGKHVLFLHLGKSFGFKVNELPFELLLQSIPIRVLRKYKKRYREIGSLVFWAGWFFAK